MIDFNEFSLTPDDLNLHQERVARIEASIKGYGPLPAVAVSQTGIFGRF